MSSAIDMIRLGGLNNRHTPNSQLASYPKRLLPRRLPTQPAVNPGLRCQETCVRSEPRRKFDILQFSWEGIFIAL